MSPSPCRSRTSAGALVATLVLALAGPGCSDPASCGPGTAPVGGLTANAGGVTWSYGALSASANNDCPAADAPAGVISLTISGTVSGGSDPISLCVPRPDLLGSGARTLGVDLGSGDVRVVDLRGSGGGCTYAFDRTVPPTGAVSAAGVCANGTDPMGFALTFNATIGLKQTCETVVTSVSATVTGTTAVAGPP
jgi:hypothetical protein